MLTNVVMPIVMSDLVSIYCMCDLLLPGPSHGWPETSDGVQIPLGQLSGVDSSSDWTPQCRGPADQGSTQHMYTANIPFYTVCRMTQMV